MKLVKSGREFNLSFLQSRVHSRIKNFSRDNQLRVKNDNKLLSNPPEMLSGVEEPNKLSYDVIEPLTDEEKLFIDAVQGGATSIVDISRETGLSRHKQEKIKEELKLKLAWGGK